MTRWKWEVTGTERRSRPGEMVRDLADGGIVDDEGDGGGAALDELCQRGDFWDMLDQDEAFTITLTPEPEDEDLPPA